MIILLKDDYDKEKDYKTSARFTEEEMMRDLELRREMFRRDAYSIIDREIEEAKKKDKMEIAKKMKQEGFDNAKISELTMLSIEDVKVL